MCTVSWLHQSGGYHLLCNRDEKRTRRPANVPSVMQRAGIRYIAPSDGNFGGTWIAVNECGLGLCLLNGNPGLPEPGRKSRGFVIPELISARCIDDCSLLIGQLELNEFAPFSLVILEPGNAASVVTWDGRRIDAVNDAHQGGTLTSSSVDADGVRAARMEERARHLGAAESDPASLYRFHISHGEEASAYSPCMHRDDAETVSFTWAVVGERDVRFLYLPAAPCQWQPGEQRILARAA
jgi:hypothetical protein